MGNVLGHFNGTLYHPKINLSIQVNDSILQTRFKKNGEHTEEKGTTMNSGGGGGDSSVGTQDSTFPHPATPPGHQQQAYFCRLAPYTIKEVVGYRALMFLNSSKFFSSPFAEE